MAPRYDRLEAMTEAKVGQKRSTCSADERRHLQRPTIYALTIEATEGQWRQTFTAIHTHQATCFASAVQAMAVTSTSDDSPLLYRVEGREEDEEASPAAGA